MLYALPLPLAHEPRPAAASLVMESIPRGRASQVFPPAARRCAGQCNLPKERREKGYCLYLVPERPRETNKSLRERRVRPSPAHQQTLTPHPRLSAWKKLKKPST